MSINRISALVVAVVVLLLPIAGAYAAGEAPSYVELKDAPTIAVDWSKGTTQAVTLGGNRTLTFSNGQKGGKYTLILRQDATGSRTISWPSSVHWAGVLGPMLTTTAGKADYLGFIFNGVTYDMVWMSQRL
ncbi:MAG TPA: hypothetical protein VMB85_03135 [Bryobacteraceae bacterium]|nr:hypothetical protein [Bryobacteraceae bacterium]